MIQLSLVRIRGYGPWTLTLGHDREHELQILQASVYGTLQRRLSDLGCLLFENRRDEFVAITNGLDRAGHEAAIRGIDPRVTLEASIGSGGTPLEADRAASLAGPGGPATGGDSACVMHLDVDGMTGRRGSSTAGGAAAEIAALHSLLWSDCMATGSLAFFMGGDNFMVAASEEARRGARGLVGRAEKELGILLNCGIGSARTGREAARLATRSLDGIRAKRAAGTRERVGEVAG
ncbi:MAG: GTP cyclohydrolase IIa [Nitrosopumilus sp.]|nr:GTP cyclohydrolase IIa [Nitrosopumilus sp.]MDA7953642.1 GTP cyclohydrolase IIa [Nitrosopumilus sp.]MDA7958165.1 GTP cyclohydrolase IIa [Nitrosopumilus sp.]MDA7998933.1 GTP cyclohydrolase IIa [Nitrosopumilus sp.]